MYITILGCGTSTGVPVPGCKCVICCSDNEKNKRTRTSALITLDSGKNILIDVSPDLRFQALREDICRIDYVLFTHSHADHILGLDDLRVFTFSRSAPIPAYGTKKTLQGIRQTFSYLFNPDPNWRGGSLTKIKLNEIESYATLELEGVTIQAFPLIHDKIEVTGFRIGDLAYATDCNKIPQKSLSVMKGVKFLFIDGLRKEPHPSHLTIDQACAISSEIGASQTFLIHMTHSVDYEVQSKELPEGVYLAYDGLKLEF